jgi:hypothetical protein
MEATNTARIYDLFPRAQPSFLDEEVEKELRILIHDAEMISMATEQERLKKGIRLFDGPVVRLCLPPSIVENIPQVHLGPGEMIDVWQGNSLVHYKLVTGETKYLRWRRQWGAFPTIRQRLRELSLTKAQRWETLYTLFDVVHGVMSLCRMQRGGTWHVLCGIRSQQLDTKNVGQLSFPAGLVKPFETLESAARRELCHEGLVNMATHYPGWVIAKFPDVPSLTFGRIMETQERNTIGEGTCFEAEGKRYLWVPQTALAQLVSGDATEAIRTFEAHGIQVPAIEKSGKQELTMTHDARALFGTYLALGL